MSKTHRKLRLDRETLVPLNNGSLDHIHGGADRSVPGSGFACSDCVSARCSRFPGCDQPPTSRPNSLPNSLVSQ